MINSFNSEYILQSIDPIDIEEIMWDFNNLQVFKGNQNPFIIENARENNESWVRIFDKPETFRDQNNCSSPLNIKIGDKTKLNFYTSILLPIKIKEGVDLREYMLCFSPTIQCVVSGETKYLRVGSTIVYNPFTMFRDFNYIKYLKDVGI